MNKTSDMTDEQKAIDIAEYNTRYYGSEFDSYKECKQSALDMAKWKDQQYDEEKRELRALVEMLQINSSNQTTIIEDLKRLLS